MSKFTENINGTNVNPRIAILKHVEDTIISISEQNRNYSDVINVLWSTYLKDIEEDIRTLRAYRANNEFDSKSRDYQIDLDDNYYKQYFDKVLEKLFFFCY